MLAVFMPANRILLAAKLQTLRVKYMIVGVVTNLLLALGLIPFLRFQAPSRPLHSN